MREDEGRDRTLRLRRKLGAELGASCIGLELGGANDVTMRELLVQFECSSLLSVTELIRDSDVKLNARQLKIPLLSRWDIRCEDGAWPKIFDSIGLWGERMQTISTRGLTLEERS